MAESMSPAPSRQFYADSQCLVIAAGQYLVSKTLLLLSSIYALCRQRSRYLYLPAILLLLPCLLSPVAAQPLLLPLTTEQGLSRGSINKLYLDRQGFLWIATSNGLNRYDATRNQVIQGHEQDMTEVNFGTVFEDQAGKLWAVASNLGLFNIDKTSGHSNLVLALASMHQPEQPMLYDAISLDAEHLLLAINKTVYRFHTTTAKLTPVYQLPEVNPGFQRIRQLWLHQQQLLIGTNKGLFHYDLQLQRGGNLVLGHHDNANHIIRRLYPWQQHLYIATGQHLFRLPLSELAKPQLPAAELLFADLTVVQMLHHQQQLLLATPKGLLQWTEARQQPELVWRFSQSNQQISSELIVDLVATEDGGLWLASRDDGAYYWHPRSTSFRHLDLRKPQSLPIEQTMNQSAVLTITAGLEQQLWFGGFQGLKQLAADSDTVTDIQFPAELPAKFGSSINRIFPAADGNLWLRTGSSLFLFSPTQGKFLAAPLQDPTQATVITDNALGHWQDQSGAFWFYNLDNYYYYQPASGELKILPGLREKLPMKLAGRLPGIVT